mmetsp:Transcript_5432/g.11076  ORF Transcript_5432/g.11076 Transcript_5432/m.11076 type:complete len:202 (+) Transcript_5432:401-1006(+)
MPSSPYGFQSTVSFQPPLFTILRALPLPESLRTGSLSPLYTRSYSSLMVTSSRFSVSSAGGSSILLRKVAPLKEPPMLVLLIDEMSKYEWSAAWKSQSSLPVFLTTILVSHDSPVSETLKRHSKSLSQMSLEYSDGFIESVHDASPSSSTLQSTLRAKPCCWISPGPNCGKQCDRPPEIGLEPSIFASGRTATHSVPSAST